jgi:phage/plasmid primase-like uncharacterized protein
MMTYRSFAAGNAGASQRMAEYLSEEIASKEMATRLAKYYGDGVMTDEGYTTEAVPREGMHPSIANLLEIDATKPLTTAQVASLLTGLTAQGNEIPDRPLPTEGQTRISAIDFCVSGPKSFDVAYALAPTEAERAILDKAFQAAADKIMDVVADTIGTVKIGADSKGVREKGHLAMIGFDHYTARPTVAIADGQDTELVRSGVFGDPKRHKHIIVMATCAADSRIGSFHQHAIKDRVHEFGALFQAFLGTELRKHGINVELDSRQGLKPHERMLRLTDVPQSACDLFSKRTAKGEESARQFAAERGMDWDSLVPRQKIKLMHEAVQSQRLGKEGGAHVETWRAEAAAAGYRHRSVLRPGREHLVADRAQRLPVAYEKSRQIMDELLEKRAVLEGSAARVAAAKALIATGVRDAEEVSTLTRAMRTHGVDQEGERTAIKWGVDSGLKFTRLTTDKWLQQEQEAIGLIKAAAADKSPALSPEAIKAAIGAIEIEVRLHGDKLDFTKGHGAKQRKIIEHLGTAGRAGLAVGVAGSGKSTLMMPLVRAWQTDGRDVYGVTLGWRQTAGLEDAGIGTFRQNRQHLLEAGIAQERTFALTPFLSRMESGQMSLDKNSVLVIDEIALIGTKDMLRLLRLQQQQGFQISGIGDDRQGQSIQAGATIDLFRRALGNDQVPELVSTTRQIRDQDKETSLLFRKGEAEQALRRMDTEGRVVIVPGGYEDTVRATVNLWFERRDANAGRDGYTLGISVPTNADGRAIGEEIHKRRRAMQEIGADLVEISTIDQQGEKSSLRLAAGDRVRLFDRVYGLDSEGRAGVVGNNGSVVEVVGADAERLIVRKASGQVATILWDDLREDAYDRRQRRRDGLPPPNANTRVRLSRGDAVTISARQSETVTEHITAMPAGSESVNGFAAYVAESRHRERSWIVISHGAEKAEIQQCRSVGDPRNNVHDPERIRDDIIQNVGRNLSRQPTKTLAQAFVERAKDLKSETIERVQKAWFWREAQIVPPRPAPTAPTASPAVVPSVEASPVTEAIKPKPASRPQLSPADIQMEFARELERMGLRLKGPPIMDGQKHTVQVDGNKGGRKSGFYRGYADGGRTSIAHNSKTGETLKWRPAGAFSRLTAAQREAQRESDRQARLAEQAARQAKEKAAATIATAIWDKAKPADPEHPYLRKKQIPPGDLRQGIAGQVMSLGDNKQINLAGRLIVPLRDDDDRIWNIQAIGRDGSKLFLPGRKMGLSFTVGDIDPAKPIMIGEGVATMATLSNTTSLTSVAALDSGNLHAVAASLRARYPETALIFAADNDHHLPRRTPPLPNVGLEKAKVAADAVGGVVVVPQFDPADKGTDWNDLRVTQGEVATRKAIEQAFASVGIAELLPPHKPAHAGQLTHEQREAAWAKADPIQRSDALRQAAATDRLSKQATQGM